MKRIVMSFDDGEIQDRVLVRMLRERGLKANFGLCCGYLGQSGTLGDGRVWVKVRGEELAPLYDGFELVSHGYFHRDFTSLNEEELVSETERDRRAIELHTGQKIRGAIYPGGCCNALAAAVLRAHGFEYARTTAATHSFGVPRDFLFWDPTCHMFDPRAEELFALFAAADSGLFHIYGHSYEADLSAGWRRLENIFDLFARSKIPSATYGEVYALCKQGEK